MRSALFLALLTGSAGALAAADAPFARPPKWDPLFVGVELADLSAERPRLMKGHAVRIDLKAAGIEFRATPGNGDRPGETDGMRTSTFLKRSKLQLAINAAPFAPIHKDENKEQDVVGVQVSGGRLVSPGQGNYPGLLLTKDNRVTIGAPPFNLEGIENAVGGFHIVLKGGAVIVGDKSVHPRTAAGVSADGRTLVLLVIDGRQKDFSDGATTAEVGEWLKALGCAEGINLDGGGTTALVVAGADGEPRVINRPIHANKPGTERVAASHLGLFARPLPKK